MPYKKTYPTKKKKTYRKRRYVRKKSTALAPSPAMPIGKKFLFKTRYVELEGYITASTVAQSNIFQLNGLYDPNITTTGHQPIGFDQLMPLYDHYTVIGAKASLTCTNTSSSLSCIAVAQVKDNSTPSSVTSEMVENGSNKYCVLGPSTSGASTKTMALGVNMSKFLGRNVMDEDNCKGTITTNPIEGVYLHVHLDSPSTSAVSMRYLLTIDYVAVLTEPKQLSSS